MDSTRDLALKTWNRIWAYLAPAGPRFRPKYVERVRCMGLCTDPGLGVWARIRCLAGYPGSGPVPAWEHGLYTGFRPKYRALDLALFQAYPWISGIRAAGLYIRYTGLPAIQARI